MIAKSVSIATVRWARLASLAVLLSFASVAAPVMTTEAQAQTQQRVFINKVYFEGNRKAKDDQLKMVVESEAAKPYDPAMVARDVERLKDTYSRSAGRAEAQITARTVPVGPGIVDVVFTIVEGDKIGIDEIRFVGNNSFSDWRLKRQMETLESGFLGWLRTTDVYDPDRVARDGEALRRFYNKRGFPDFRIVSTSADLNESGDGFILTITVDEGQPFTFGGSTIQSSIPEVAGDSLTGYISTRDGATYNAEEVERTVETMTARLSATGFPFAQVRPRGERVAGTNTVNITYQIEDGARVYIERIEVRGNTRTRDYVVRREFDVAEGDAYNQVLIDQAERRLRRLAFFDRITISTEPGSTPDRVIVVVDVEDKATGEFSVGGGYSTSDGFIGEVSIAERNFLGRGQYVKLSGKWGEKTTGVTFSFTEPYFMGERIQAGFDIYANSSEANDYSYYDVEQTGLTLRAAFPITDNFAIGVRYTALNKDISVADARYNDCGPGSQIGVPATLSCFNNGEVSNAIKEILGSRFLSMAGYSLTYSTVDDTKIPTSGIYAVFHQDIAGLGGDSSFIRTRAEGRYYYPITDDLTAMFKVQGGYIASFDGDLNATDHFNIGPDLVRGFAPGGIGPRDVTNNSSTKGNSLGGTIYYGATAELQFPILGLPREVGLRGALFADIGTLYGFEGKKNYSCAGPIFPCGTIDVYDESELRSSVGVSVLWASPLGPIRFDYATPLQSGKYDVEQEFRFSGGTTF